MSRALILRVSLMWPWEAQPLSTLILKAFVASGNRNADQYISLASKTLIGRRHHDINQRDPARFPKRSFYFIFFPYSRLVGHFCHLPHMYLRPCDDTCHSDRCISTYASWDYSTKPWLDRHRQLWRVHERCKFGSPITAMTPVEEWDLDFTLILRKRRMMSKRLTRNTSTSRSTAILTSPVSNIAWGVLESASTAATRMTIMTGFRGQEIPALGCRGVSIANQAMLLLPQVLQP